jgi:polyferredoxin
MHLLAPKYLVYYGLATIALVLLLRGRVRPWNRLALQLAAFLVLGGALVALVPGWERELGLHPSPMCSLGRLLQRAIVDKFAPPMLVLSLGVILGLSFVAKKLFCGWVCPLGAFQELLHAIPGIAKVRNLPFAFTNGVRAYLFVITIIGLFLFGVYPYEGINAFELLHWDLDFPMLTLGIGLLSLCSLFYFRPYCHLVCPIGLVTWMIERVAVLRVRFRPNRCTSCRVCGKAAPCASLAPLVENRGGWLPDCTSCGLCVAACPEKALTFGWSFRSRKVDQIGG